MCGINLIITAGTKQINEPLEAMQKATKFRGPDSSNTFETRFSNRQLAIGVNRLHVVDGLQQSDQPMISDCGNYILAYNGEVYNYQNLKNQLLVKGYKLKTDSDTEVVLYWLQEFGRSGIADFKGMFALVFIDLEKEEIIVARDRHGIKPLFYYQTKDVLLISSSILAIESSGLAKLTLNINAIEDYLAYRHVMGARSFYQEVFPYQPGVANLYDEKLLSTQRTIEAKPIDNLSDLKSILIDTMTLLNQSQSQPGLLLSGGVDSTLLLAMMRNELGLRGIKTYTLNTGEDAAWAKKAAVQYDSHHHEVAVDIDSLHRINDFLRHTDQPIADSGAFATYLISEEAAKNSNVLFSGAGADELFGGYNRHRAYNYYLLHRQRLLQAKKIMKFFSLAKFIPTGLRQLLSGVESDPQATYRNYLQNHAVSKNHGSECLWSKQNSLLNNMELALEFDRTNYLVADVLAITDNATMQQGVEGRVPFLYDDVFNYARVISVEHKMKNKGKSPLKKLLADYGGEKFANRKKLGFGLQLNIWLRDKRTHWLWEFLETDSPIFQYLPKTKISQLLEQHRQAKSDNSMQLWSILVLEKWLDKNYQ